MKNWNKLFLGAAISLSLFVTSCSSDDDNPGEQPPQGDYVNGYFVLNEGNFGGSNASVSFVSNDGTVYNNIYNTVNGEGLGDTAQSILLDEDRAYIVVNGSNKIEVVNRYTFESIGTISTGLMNPRYIQIENGNGYVSNWGDPTNPSDDFIAVINLSSFTVSSTISVSEGPERMEEENGKLFVAHAGGYGYGNSVSVISTSNNTVSATIPVGDVPNSLVEEGGILYVLCAGKAAWTEDETLGKLVLINTANNAVTSTLEFPETMHPSQLVEDEGKLYYTIDNNIYSANMNLTSLPVSPVFSTSEQGVYGVYGFEVENNKIYVADAGDFMSNGKILIYSTTGILENTLSVGALPNGIYFND